MPGARRRGRPHTAWTDNIKTWTELSVEESVRMTEDRDKWKKSTSMVWPSSDRGRPKNRTDNDFDLRVKSHDAARMFPDALSLVYIAPIARATVAWTVQTSFVECASCDVNVPLRLSSLLLLANWFARGQHETGGGVCCLRLACSPIVDRMWPYSPTCSRATNHTPVQLLLASVYCVARRGFVEQVSWLMCFAHRSLTSSDIWPHTAQPSQLQNTL